jgi:hypothetical protein
MERCAAKKSIDALWHEWNLCSERAAVACDCYAQLAKAGVELRAQRLAADLRDALLDLSDQARDRYLAALAKPLTVVK